MNKPICLIVAPVMDISGYSEISREICHHFISYKNEMFDIKIVPTKWASCAPGGIDSIKDKAILDRLVRGQLQLTENPSVAIFVGLPDSFPDNIGKYRILYYAGVESDRITKKMVDTINNKKIDLVLTISEHSKRITESSVYDERDPSGKLVNQYKVKAPVEIIHPCIDPIFRPLSVKERDSEMIQILDEMPQKYLAFYSSQWGNGDVGHDRKNIGLLIKLFCEAFKDYPQDEQPALILKTGIDFSNIEQSMIIERIKSIKESIQGDNLPEIRLLHGNITPLQFSSIYNHRKIKAFISLAREGYGLSIAQSSACNVPQLTAGWGGSNDIVTPELSLMIGGEMQELHHSVRWEGILEGRWMYISEKDCVRGMQHIMNPKNFPELLKKAETLGELNRKRFSQEAMQAKTHQILDQYLPKFASIVPLNLPKLKKVVPKSMQSNQELTKSVETPKLPVDPYLQAK